MSNNNNNNNNASNKRKRRGRSSMSLASSVSSVSSGESDSSYHHDDNNNNNKSLGKKNNHHTSPNRKSVFSGFWSDAEIEDVEKESTTTSKSNKSSSKSSNNNANNGRVDYEGFYLTIGDTVYEIGVGDVVAMRNSIEPEYGPGDHRRYDKEESQRQSKRSEDPMPLEPTLEYTADAEIDKPSDFYKENTEKDFPSSIKPPAPIPTAVPALKEAKIGDGLMLARVERIWQENTTKGRRRGSNSTTGNTTSSNSNSNSNSNWDNNTQGSKPKILFQARWFLKKEDVDALPLGELTGPISSEQFANSITDHDLVLSNQSDDNHVTTICDLVQVLYRNPKLDTEMPSHVLPATYLCRYSLRIDDDSRVVVLPYTGENDDWKEMTISALNSKKRNIHGDDEDENENGVNLNHNEIGGGNSGHLLHHLLTPPQAKRPSDNTTGMTTSAQKRRRVGDFATEEGIDDGLTMQIQVGPDHQVPVPRFDPNKYSNPETIVSRNPVRMWKPDKISQDGTDEYIERAAKILTPYLRMHHLTQEEPYAPFPTQRMEELSRSLSRKRLPTLSSVSSISSLTTHKVDALREFNIDALLRNLHVSNYNVDAAIAAIEASPKDYLVAWSPHEKARFNTGFRRYSGSLRAIYKGMGDKSLSDVIDYHYRFKIPDQFRKIQERKREQAIRMLECIETKRNLNAPIVVTSGTLEEIRDNGDWTRTGSSSLAVSIEERRVKAKELLLDVEAKLGRNKMMKVFEVFKHADETSIAECKTKLLEIFSGHQDFQSRFLEFLPMQLRL